MACPESRPPVSGEGGLFLSVADGGPTPADKVGVRSGAVQVDVALLGGKAALFFRADLPMSALRGPASTTRVRR